MYPFENINRLVVEGYRARPLKLPVTHDQWFSAFLVLRPFLWVPHAMLTPNHKIAHFYLITVILLLFRIII